MKTCSIIDDDLYAISGIENFILKVPQLSLLNSYSNPIDALCAISKGEVPDIMFLDIEMPELSGFDVLESIPNGVAIIITTSHSKYSMQAIENDVMGFLLKPISFEMFSKCIFKTIAKLDNDRTQLQKKDHKSIFLISSAKGKIVQISTDEIVHVKAIDHYANIHTRHGDYMIYISLKEVQERLPSSFIRIHRSYIVNLDFIKFIEGGHIIMKDESRISLGESYKQTFLESIRYRTIKGFKD